MVTANFRGWKAKTVYVLVVSKEGGFQASLSTHYPDVILSVLDAQYSVRLVRIHGIESLRLAITD